MDFINFIDDSTVFAKHEDLKQSVSNVNDELEIIYNLVHCNRLSLNILGTTYNYMVLSKTSVSFENPKLRGFEKKRVSHMKFFRIHFR